MVSEVLAKNDRRVKSSEVNESIEMEQKRTKLPSSQKKFGWKSERIALALLTKLDTFTARDEDYSRKLLWTFGNDQSLKPGGAQPKTSLGKKAGEVYMTMEWSTR